MNELVIIGLGSQAKAWAANLTDSGHKVLIALRENSSSKAFAIKKGYQLLNLESNELSDYKNFILLTPDHTHLETLSNLAPRLQDGSNIIYAHGYSYSAFNLKEKFPKLNHLLLAPKAIASEVRFQFENEGKLGAAYSLEGISGDKTASSELIFTIAKSIGITAGPYETTFLEETNADLFSEQTLLCSILPYGALHSYNKLREKGVKREIAYLECWLEVKLIADAMVKMGPIEFFKLISPNALIGGEKAQQILFDKQYHQKLDSLAEDIWNKKFFTECETLDFNSLRSEVLTRWEAEELVVVHNELGPELINK
ncbi:NAD(P)-binding domain-containing protein [Halobacteriovorax sp. HLS]|uniref:NAD(P)-binding domain-containing protein n=1 Tax=Halobacteriovorax sp. HLS TaxID=2234000 RepID=UPI000FDB15EA|nr:NAD(P)-binding domain-containing protein [Halobacteriovorax sp. HLS]